jgi:hypothetical protein
VPIQSVRSVILSRSSVAAPMFEVSVCVHTKCQERNIEQIVSVAAMTFGGQCMCPYKVSAT